MDAKEKYKLKKFIEELEVIRGRHTELVSVYIPVGYELNKIIAHLKQEQDTASNIKDKTNRQRVQDSLEKMIRHLRLFKKTPDNGLAVFSGNASGSDTKVDLRVWSIEPPDKVTIRMYRCDQTFVLDLLKEMMEHKEVYGLIVLDKREANVGLLKGTYVEQIAHFDSDVPGKTTKGGQCCHPTTFVDLADNSLKMIKDVKKGDLLKSYNLETLELEDSECTDVWRVKHKSGLRVRTDKNEIICSKDHACFAFSSNQLLEVVASQLKVGDILLDSNLEPIAIIEIEEINCEEDLIDISVKNRNFIANGILVHNSQQRFARLRDIAAHEFFKKVGDAINKAFLEMKELKGIIIGGPGPTKEEFLKGDYLNNELKKKVIGVEDLGYTGEFGLDELVDKSQGLLAKEAVMEEKKIVQDFLTLLASEPNKVAYNDDVDTALEYGAVKILLLSDSLDAKTIERYEKKVEETGAEVRLISGETREGKQLEGLGGKGAILRFAIN